LPASPHDLRGRRFNCVSLQAVFSSYLKILGLSSSYGKHKMAHGVRSGRPLQPSITEIALIARLKSIPRCLSSICCLSRATYLILAPFSGPLLSRSIAGLPTPFQTTNNSCRAHRSPVSIQPTSQTRLGCTLCASASHYARRLYCCGGAHSTRARAFPR
jgi:hypothetical protein